MLENVFVGLLAALEWQSLLAMVLGTIVGIVIGAIPGISATMGIALAVPFTFVIEPLAALGLLAGIHNGASFGGAIPAILMRIPGTPGGIVTAWDGYPMAKAGQAAPAIKLAAVSSAIGGMFGAVALVMLAPPLAAVALAFGPPELFWVNVFGLTAVATLLGRDLVRGVVSVCLGLLISTVGIDGVTGQERYTFGLLELTSGLSVAVVMIGLFSLPPTWQMLIRPPSDAEESIVITHARAAWKAAKLWGVWLQSSLIGIGLGILPGFAVTSFIAYEQARRSSREPEMFGKGSAEGLAAAEAVNNADNAAAMIPTLTLGVPGSAIAALIMGVLLVHGFQVGPLLFRDAPRIVYGYSWQMFLTAALLLLFGGVFVNRLFARILDVPRPLLAAIIVCLVVAGSFAMQNAMFNVYIAFGFGLVGLGMMKLGFPLPPVVIGAVLGSIAEFNFGVSMLMSGGDPTIMVTRPVSLIIIGLIVLVLSLPLIGWLRRRARAGGPGR